MSIWQSAVTLVLLGSVFTGPVQGVLQFCMGTGPGFKIVNRSNQGLGSTCEEL